MILMYIIFFFRNYSTQINVSNRILHILNFSINNNIFVIIILLFTLTYAYHVITIIAQFTFHDY